MRLRREDLREVKQAVDRIAAEVAGARVLRLAPAPALSRPVTPQATRDAPIVAAPAAAPEPVDMDGVVPTGPALATAAPPDAMEGVERWGLFVLQHAPEPGEPVPTPAPEARKKDKGKSKAKAVQIAVPPSTTPACKPKGWAQQQRRQAQIDEARAEAGKTGPKAGAAAPSTPALVRLILKRLETAEVEKRAEEKRKQERGTKKAEAQARWKKEKMVDREEAAYPNGLADLRDQIEAENEGVVVPPFSMRWMRSKKLIEQHFQAGRLPKGAASVVFKVPSKAASAKLLTEM